MTSSHSRWVAMRKYVRMRSDRVLLIIGLLWSVGAAFAWYRQWIGPIGGSLFVGIGASVIAAALVAALSPFSESAYRRFISLGIDEFWPSREAIKKRNWVDWLAGVNHECVLLGIAHGEWCKDARFSATLRDRLVHGVWVKMLFLDPNSQAAALRAHEEGNKRDTREAIRESIKFVWEFRQGLEAGFRNRLRLYVYNATPSCGLTWIDDFMIVTHYLAGRVNRTSPALQVKQPHIGMERSLYDIYAENEQEIENLSVEIDERNIQQFLSHRTLTKEGANTEGRGSDAVLPEETRGETKGA